MTRIAFYPGSFDPFTNGHADVLEQALDLVDRVVIGVGENPGKSPMFMPEERVELIREVIEGNARMRGRVEAKVFPGLAIAAARLAGAGVMIRGLRDGTDLDFEMQLAGMNAAMAPEIRTVFLPASVPVRHLTATLVRQIASMGGDFSIFVPEAVAGRLAARLSVIR